MSENALLEFREGSYGKCVGMTSTARNRVPSASNNGAVGARLPPASSRKYFKDLGCELASVRALKLGGGGQRDPAAEVDENDVHQRRQFFRR